MNTTNLITITLDGNPVFRAVYQAQEQGEASYMAGVILDRLADNTGLHFSYEVATIPWIGGSALLSDIHDAAAEGFVRAKFPVKNQPVAAAPVSAALRASIPDIKGATAAYDAMKANAPMIAAAFEPRGTQPAPHVITPENSTFHLTRRGHELMNANMLDALKLARVVCEDAHEDAKVLEGCGKTPEAIQSTAAARIAEAVSAAIDAAEGVGIRAQSFAERERDLLEANNRYLEEARAARRALRAVLPYAEIRAEDSQEDAEGYREGSELRTEAQGYAAKATAAVDAAKALLGIA